MAYSLELEKPQNAIIKQRPVFYGHDSWNVWICIQLRRCHRTTFQITFGIRPHGYLILIDLDPEIRLYQMADSIRDKIGCQTSKPTILSVFSFSGWFWVELWLDTCDAPDTRVLVIKNYAYETQTLLWESYHGDMGR